MPMHHKFVEPEVFLSHKGINVYRVYQDNDIDKPVLEYTFTLNPRADDEHFDVRALRRDITEVDPALLLPGFERNRIAYINQALQRMIDHDLVRLAATRSPVFPELALAHRGVRVFHTYVGGEPDRGRLNYLFTLNSSEISSQNADGVFDIKTLLPGNVKYVTGAYEEVMEVAGPLQEQQRARWKHWDKEVRHKVVENLLIQAIEQGKLVAP